MSAFSEPGDTWRYPQPIPGNASRGVSSLLCGCRLPESCSACDGVDAEQSWREQLADIRAVRDAFKAGELTARQFYLRSMAVSFDGMPDREAVRAMDRAGWPTTDDQQGAA